MDKVSEAVSAVLQSGSAIRVGPGRVRAFVYDLWHGRAGWSGVILLVAAMIIGGIWFATFERISYERETAEDSAIEHNSNLAIAFEEQTARVFKTVELIISQVSREYRQHGPNIDIREIVQQGHFGENLFNNIGVLDISGKMVAGYQLAPGMDFSDREVFMAHLRDGSDELHIAVPLRSRANGEWVIPVSRRLTQPDGSFAGVVFVGLNPHFFTNFYLRADLGTHGVVNLVGIDGYTRARRSGEDGTFGRDRRNSMLAAEQAKAPIGHFVTRGLQEGVQRFQSYRTLYEYPLIVAVGTSVEESLAEFNQRKRNYFLIAVLASVATVLFAGGLLVLLARQRRSRRELEFKNIVLTTQQEVSLDAILHVDGEGKIVSYNRRFVELWRLPAELVHAGDDAPVLARVVEQIEEPEAYLSRVNYLYEHRSEKSKDEIRTRDGRTIERYSAPMIGPGSRYLGRVWYFRDVTEFLRSLSELRKSDLRFRQLGQAMGETFWMAPPDLSAIVYVSPAFQTMWGRTCEELYANPNIWFEAIHEEDVPGVNHALEELAGGKPYDIEFRIRRPDGTERWINDRGYAMRDETGKVVLTSGVASDVTDRKSAETVARMEEQRRQAILDSIPDIAWLKDTDSRFLAVNEALARMAGVPAADLIGKTDADFLPAEIADRYRSDDMEIMRVGEHRRVEEAIVNAAGERRLIETIKTRVCDPGGRVIGTAGIARDITERRLSEEQLRLSATAFESIADGIVVTDADRNIVFVNNATCRITGYAAEEMLGKTPRHFQSGRQSAEFYAGMWSALNRDGQWRGEIWNRRKNGEIYPQLLSVSAAKDAAGAITHYVGVATDISSLKQYEEQLHHQAHHDALTGLPNRPLFQERFRETLTRAQRHGYLSAVLFLDLDHFKNINDSLGHAVGDLLLESVSRRLASSVREVDTVSRFGGDEFAVLLDTVDDSRGAAVVAQKLLDALAQPFQIEGHELFISVSIGISCYPQDGAEAEELFKNADTAMYRAKAEGRNNYQFFSAEMNAKALENLQMSNHLRLALDRGELLLHYQPCVDLKTGRVSSAEALIRWNHPRYGMVPPSRFIPLAEETGLIEPIGEWVLRTACCQMREWLDAGLPLRRVAVNLSARQFRQPDLARRIAIILADARLPAHHLELEVTESMVMQNPDSATALLAQLKAMGMSIAIDDFGTGYSSLSYLKRFPIDFLKIDRSFVSGVSRDADDAAITKAIIALAKSLDLKLIAEGIETTEQSMFLKEQGCDEGQGYLFSKPVPAEAIARQLSLMRENAELAA